MRVLVVIRSIIAIIRDSAMINLMTSYKVETIRVLHTVRLIGPPVQL